MAAAWAKISRSLQPDVCEVSSEPAGPRSTLRCPVASSASGCSLAGGVVPTAPAEAAAPSAVAFGGPTVATSRAAPCGRARAAKAAGVRPSAVLAMCQAAAAPAGFRPAADKMRGEHNGGLLSHSLGSQLGCSLLANCCLKRAANCPFTAAARLSIRSPPQRPQKQKAGTHRAGQAAAGCCVRRRPREAGSGRWVLPARPRSK